MLIHKVLVGAAFAAAIAVTAVFTSVAGSSAIAAGAGNYAVDRPMPDYLLRWENPLLPPAPVAPILGQ